MHFEVLGPYELPTKTIIKKSHIAELKKAISGDEKANSLSVACGCYVFAVRTSATVPWYVGKAVKQTVMAEATNAAHLQLYNEILDEYERGIPVLYFLPALQPSGKPRVPAAGEENRPAVDFLEDWLISTALKRNANLWNVRQTKMLRELYVRSLFNPRQGDLTNSSSSLKSCLAL